MAKRKRRTQGIGPSPSFIEKVEREDPKRGPSIELRKGHRDLAPYHDRETPEDEDFKDTIYRRSYRAFEPRRM